MAKKYKVEIPEMIPKGLLSKAISYKELDGKTVTEDKDLRGDTQFLYEIEPGKYQILNFPKEWLKEIKHPITIEEWFEEQLQAGLKHHAEEIIYAIKEYTLACHEWTIENESLKHEPKQRFDECYENYVTSVDRSLTHGIHEETRLILRQRRRGFEDGWNYYAKNRGYDEE